MSSETSLADIVRLSTLSNLPLINEQQQQREEGSEHQLQKTRQLAGTETETAKHGRQDRSAHQIPNREPERKRQKKSDSASEKTYWTNVKPDSVRSAITTSRSPDCTVHKHTHARD